MNDNLFISPHNDDAGLFGAFTIQQHKPLVLTVFDSYVQVKRGHADCSLDVRRDEDRDAVTILGAEIQFLGLDDSAPVDGELVTRLEKALISYRDDHKFVNVWIPALEPNGHDQHNLVAQVARRVFLDHGVAVWEYFTYTRTNGKSKYGEPVKMDGKSVATKLKAMLCYKTQIEIDALGCWPHFARGLEEYVRRVQ